MLKEMWQKLRAHTVSAKTGQNRAVNVRNEWGGFSDRLEMPVFTGWQDHASKIAGQNRMLISDTTWKSISGVNNQERWVKYAIDNECEAAYFLIKAVDPTKSPRSVEWLDDTRVLCGKVVRLGTQSFVLATREIQL